MLHAQKTIKDVEEIYRKKLVFFDFETSQSSGTHIPVLVVALSLDGERRVWEGPDCAVKFLKHYRKNKHNNTTFVSHYGKGVDHHIILNTYVGEGLSTFVIAQGSKIILIVDNNFQLKFIDSFSFIPIPLRAFPEALGCQTQLKKGYFPRKFNDFSKNGYKGQYPPPEMYGADEMSAKQREDFFNWYHSVKDEEFHYDAELVANCENDVQILAEAVIHIRDEFIKTTGCDPDRQCDNCFSGAVCFSKQFLKTPYNCNSLSKQLQNREQGFLTCFDTMVAV